MGNGAAPFISAWLNDADPLIGGQILYAKALFEDTNQAEGVIWDNWYFGQAPADTTQILSIQWNDSWRKSRSIAY